MAKEKRSVATCLLVLLAVALLLIAILWASMDWIKDKLGLEKPQSKVGSYIDENIPQFEAVRQERIAKLTLQLSAHMKGIKNAYAQFYIFNDRFPEDLEELVSGRVIGREALTDLWGQRHQLVEEGQEVYMVSAGPDRVFNTADDLAISMKSPGLELSDEEKERIPYLVADRALSATP